MANRDCSDLTPRAAGTSADRPALHRRARTTEWAGYWGAVQEVSDRNGGTYRLPGRPWHFSRDELAPLGDPAFQGEHNRDVFHELGLSDDEINGYIASGVLVGVSVG